jgi:type IV pilus assembly protein PilM
LLELRPAFPPVAIEIDRGQMTLVRLTRKRKTRPVLESFRIQAAPEHAVGATIFRPNLGSLEELTGQARALFETSGTKPGKVSLILPDNLAKVSIVTLPERPATRKQLREMLRFKLRRSVPFRLEEAVISSWVLPGAGPELNVLVAVMMRSVVEQYEAAFEAAGARPGLIDLCTPSLFNLVRPALAKAVAGGSDAALLNCTRNYFTLMIVRADRVVFFRCKTYAGGEEDDASGRLAVMARELASSLSYYTEKLGGSGVGTVFVRAVSPGLDEVVPVLERVGVASVRAIDAAEAVDPASPRRFEPVDGQRLAPALGAATGRTAA